MQDLPSQNSYIILKVSRFPSAEVQMVRCFAIWQQPLPVFFPCFPGVAFFFLSNTISAMYEMHV